MLKNKKGQALVEFVIILPLFIMIVFCLVDFGKIFYVKNDLEATMDKVITMYNNNKNYDAIKSYVEKNVSDSKLDITNDNNQYVIFEIGKEVDIFTPGLNLVLGDPYITTVKRVIPNE
jgi:Flp pilus assembly protein TadG